MFKNYLKIAWRNIYKNKTYAFINVFGLGMGMAVFLFVAIFTAHHLSFDSFHAKKENIYRINAGIKMGNAGIHYTSSVMTPLGPTLRSEFPGIQAMTRIKGKGRTLISHGDRRFYEEGFLWGDAEFFDIFSFPLKAGNPQTALQQPYSIVITEAMAHKYFPEEASQNLAAILGKSLRIDNKSEYTITAIAEEVPANSSLQFAFLADYPSYLSGVAWAQEWGNYHLKTFVLLDESFPSTALEAAFAGILEKHGNEGQAGFVKLFLQRSDDIHLQSVDPAGGGLLTLMIVLGSLGTVILLIACINFMNLATARSATRAKEVGLRKVIGAARRQLIGQFIGESILLSALALPLALILVRLFLPLFNEVYFDLAQQTIPLSLLNTPLLYLGLPLLAILVGVIGGSYPAIFLSRFSPSQVLKTSMTVSLSGRASKLRKGLVVVQFVFSIYFILSTVILYQQIDYLKNRDLGFTDEQVISMPLEKKSLSEKGHILKENLLQHHQIQQVSLSLSSPARNYSQSSLVYPEDVSREERWNMHGFAVDYHYLETFDLTLLEGRNFSQELSTDALLAYIINETAVKKFGWENPIGKTIQVSGSQEAGVVIGVVKDFHFLALHNQIEPVMMYIDPRSYHTISVKARGEDLPAIIDILQQEWQAFAPDFPFEVTFLNEEAGALYQKYEIFTQILRACALFAVLIACLGLFGLAAFTAEQRTKEIGIRKVLGAPVSKIILLLTGEFTLLILIASVIAWPLVYFGMGAGLQFFAYRTDLSLMVFIVSTLAVLGIAWLTVAWQAIRAALANPVETLRYE